MLTITYYLKNITTAVWIQFLTQYMIFWLYFHVHQRSERGIRKRESGKKLVIVYLANPARLFLLASGRCTTKTNTLMAFDVVEQFQMPCLNRFTGHDTEGKGNMKVSWQMTLHYIVLYIIDKIVNTMFYSTFFSFSLSFFWSNKCHSVVHRLDLKLLKLHALPTLTNSVDRTNISKYESSDTLHIAEKKSPF